jgi:hypothetical protein
MRSPAAQAAPSVWQRMDGGFTFDDAPNAVTSAAAIVRRASMRRSTTRPPAIPSSIASSLARTGFTTTEREKLLRVPSCPALTRIRRVSQRRGPRGEYPQNGKASSTSNGNGVTISGLKSGADTKRELPNNSRNVTGYGFEGAPAPTGSGCACGAAGGGVPMESSGGRGALISQSQPSLTHVRKVPSLVRFSTM